MGHYASEMGYGGPSVNQKDNRERLILLMEALARHLNGMAGGDRRAEAKLAYQRLEEALLWAKKIPVSEFSNNETDWAHLS